MRIGEMAERTGVSVKTIRYYEDIDVLPEPARTPSGYRDYDESTVDRLAFIRAAQSVGLTLGEIRQVVALRDDGQSPCGHVVDLLRQRGAEMEHRITEMRRLADELQRLVDRASHLDPTECDPSLVCHVIAPGSR